MRRILTALALAVCLTAPAAATSSDDKTIYGSVMIAAAFTCPSDPIPTSLLLAAMVSYAETMGLKIEDARTELAMAGALVAADLKEKGKFAEFCRISKTAAAKSFTF